MPKETFGHAMAIALIALSLEAAPARKSAPSRARIPDVDFKLGVQRVENGKLDPSIHILRLTCLHAQCTLSTLSVSECSDSPLTGNQSFYPSFDVKSTAAGNLKVVPDSNTLLVEERGSDLGGEYISTLRFGYERRPWGTLALVEFREALQK